MIRTVFIFNFFIFLVYKAAGQNDKVIQADHLKGEKQQVEKVIHCSIGWAKNKDINLLYSIIANDTSFIEVHPDEKLVRGFEDFKKAEKFWLHPDFKAIRYEIKGLTINISKSGDVAWFFCMLDDINEWKGQPANWENTRWTGVLEKRRGNGLLFSSIFLSQVNNNKEE